MDIAYSSFLRKVDSYSTKSKRLKVNGDILESSRKHQGSNLFPSSRSKILDYKKRLKLVNEMIDKEIDLFLYETEKQQHDNIKNSLKHLDSLRNLLDTNYEISSKKDIVILLLELLDHTLKSDTITSYNETHVKNNFPTKCCQLCGCSCKMQSKRVQSLSPGWKLSARELGKPYLTKVFDLNSDDRLEKCSICNTTIIGKHSAGICE